MRKIFLLGSFLCLTVLLVAPAMAVPQSFNDDFTKPGFDINYGLTVVGNTVTFTIVVNQTPLSPMQWYIGAFNIKLFEGLGNSPATIVEPIYINGDFYNANWLVTDGIQNTNISLWGWSRTDGQSGFYNSNLVGIPRDSGFTLGGLQLVEGYSATFQFNFSGTGIIYEDGMPFQVGYFGYDNEKKQYKFGQLSDYLTVPEPATMLLLGAGLLGIALFGRRRLFSR